MTYKNITLFLLVIVVIFLLVIGAYPKDNKMDELFSEYVVDESDILNSSNLLDDHGDVFSEITEKEKEGLLLMREEEKLARDVYRYLGERWKMNIFFNIAESEQTHTDAVRVLLVRYNIEDPVKDDAPGKFTSAEMLKLYDDLTKKGEVSLVEALTVGAIVEDLDIKDLDILLRETDKSDIILTYKNLQKGSRNHIRAFVKNLERRGFVYQPKYISNEIFEQIISSEQERGTLE